MAGKNLRRISRREFIHLSALGTTALLGCRRVAQQNAGRSQVRGACMHDCPDTCSWIVTTENGRAVTLEADEHRPLTPGALCEKMDGFLIDVVYNPDRLL